MKRNQTTENDEVRQEYDFSVMDGGVRGKYVEDYRQGTNLVLLAPDVAAVFHDADSVNDALRSLIDVARAKVPSRREAGSNKAAAH
jgi:hypothetical protein